MGLTDVVQWVMEFMTVGRHEWMDAGMSERTQGSIYWKREGPLSVWSWRRELRPMARVAGDDMAPDNSGLPHGVTRSANMEVCQHHEESFNPRELHDLVRVSDTICEK